MSRRGCGTIIVLILLVVVAARLAQPPEAAALPTLALLPSVTPTPAATPTATASETPAPSATDTATNTETSVPTATITDTAVPTATETATASATQIPTTAPTATAVFDEATYVQDLKVGLSIAAGGRNIKSIRVAQGPAPNNDRTIIVSYESTEASQSGYIDEWIDIFSAIAATIAVDHLDVDSISLIAGVEGQAVGILISSAENLMAFFNGEIDRAEFLKRLDTSTF